VGFGWEDRENILSDRGIMWKKDGENQDLAIGADFGVKTPAQWPIWAIGMAT